MFSDASAVLNHVKLSASQVPVVQQMLTGLEALNTQRLRVHWNHVISHPRWRRFQKGCYDFRMTLICGFITLLVLRGTMGAGKFGTPEQDIVLKNREMSQKLSRGVHDPAVPFSLGPHIADWDLQREEFLTENANLSGTVDSPKMMLVTGSTPDRCKHPIGDHLLLKSLKNKIDYCRHKGIEVHFNLAVMDVTMSGGWSKLPLLRRLMLVNPEVEWFWWIDADAFVTDLKFKLPMRKYSNHSLVLHGWEDLVYKEKDWVGLNTGSFLIRNCQWSLDLLDEWALMGPEGSIRDEAGRILTAGLKGRPTMEADDQSALVWLLSQERNKWGFNTFFETSYHLHGYWATLSPRYEEMMQKHHSGLGDHRWPFVTHFVGCQPCEEFGDQEVDRCIVQMNRALVFGDDQVLRRYGFRHVSLSTSAVMRMNITTRVSIAESHAVPRKPKAQPVVP